MATEIFDTAEDGTVLHWDVYTPTGTPKAVVLVFHGGRFAQTTAPSIMVPICQDLAANGYWALNAQCRLIAPGTLAGQVSDGRYPDQANDAKRAVLAVAGDGRFSGLSVLAMGAQAGGAHAWMVGLDTNVQASPVAWGPSDCVDGVIALSAYTAFDSRVVGVDLSTFKLASRDYCGTGVPEGAPELAICLADSPVSFVTSAAPPSLFFHSSDDTQPITQHDRMVAAMDAVPLSNYTTGEIPSTTNLSGFDYWAQIKLQVIDWLNAFAAGDPPPPPIPPPSGGLVPRGCVVIPVGQPISQTILNNPKVDIAGAYAQWDEIEPTEGNYDFTALTAEIKRISAAGKRVLLRIFGSGGSVALGGRTPNWVFTAMGVAPGGDLRTFTDGVTINGDPTVTSDTAKFHVGDLFAPISGTGIPSNSYIGLVNDIDSIELSSSNTVNTPVNATADGTNITLTLSSRPVVSPNTNDFVPGINYTYLDSGNHPGTHTIPCFYDPTYRAKKNRLFNELGDYLMWHDNLTQAEKASIGVVAVSFSNASTEDWNIPIKNTIDPGYDISQVNQWLFPSHSDVYTAEHFGCDYTTQKMIDTAINSADVTLTDVHTYSTTRLTSAKANFMYADVGKTIRATGILTPGTTIAAWVSHDEVTLSANALTTATNQTVTIELRATGIFDVIAAAFPNCAITNPVGSSGTVLDAAHAQDEGDTDVKYHLARFVHATARAAYPGRIIAQVNSINNIMETADAVRPESRFALLKEIQQTQGGIIAGQDLWHAYGDPTYRMNGGSADDPDNPGTPLTEQEILFHTIAKFGTYFPYYLELWNADANGIPSSIDYIHDTLNPDPIEPPPPPPSPITISPPRLFITGSNYRREVIFQVADLINIDYTTGLSEARARRWDNSINRNIKYAWQLFQYPELEMTEERAFAPIWNADMMWKANVLLYYIGALNEDLDVIGAGYYIAFTDPPIGTLPTDTNYFLPYSLTASDYFIPTLQLGRRRIGDMFGVFPSDPRQGPLNYSPFSLNYRLSGRGIEVLNWSAGDTVFIRYRVVPYQYSSVAWNIATSYATGALAMWTDGEVYRAIVPVSGVIPPSDVNKWAHVPFPKYFSEYCSYMAAADDSDDTDAAGDFRKLANDFLTREMDRTWVQGLTTTYNFGAYGSLGAPMQGTSSFTWSISAPFSAADSRTTISDVYLDEWGSVIPVP